MKPKTHTTDKRDMAIGASLRHKRHAAKMSLADLARITKLDKATLSRIETGKRILKIADLMKISAALKIDAARLLDRAARAERDGKAL